MFAIRNETDSNKSLFSCYPTDTSLVVSIKLPFHVSSVKMTLQGNNTIQGVRVGLSAEYSRIGDSWTQALNFSKMFHDRSKMMSQNMNIHLELTKVINVTEGLTKNDQTTYSGLWFPTFTFDPDQLFKNTTLLNDHPQTILDVGTSETPFFTILFAGICIDLLAMLFLLLGLWIIPVIKLFFHKLLQPNNW
ncbi:unnamed protein product, partial [Adineta ricciae]